MRTNNPAPAKKYIWVLIAFIVVKFLLQYVLIHPEFDLQRDEYLHLDQADHLAWGYISVPPFTSWISYIIRLLGNGVFWVKFFPALFGALTMLVVWKIIEELKGSLFALLLGSLAILVSVILRINILFQPNSLDIFFWTLLYYAIVKYISTQNGKWLYAAATAFAFGFLSKYNIVFLVIGLLPALLLTEHRKVFAQKQFYFSFGLAFIIILPNLIWQYANNFPTVSQLKELAETQLVNVKRLDFLKEQFLYFVSSAIIIVAAFIGFIFYPPFKKYRIFLGCYLFTIALFTFMKAKAYYAIGLYPVLIAFGSVYLETLTVAGYKKYFRPVLMASVAGLAVPLILIAFPIQSPSEIHKNNKLYKALGMLRWEDGKEHNLPQDFADMIGWSDLAKQVDSVYKNIDDKAHTLVLCDNYGQAGAINYYSSFKNMNAVSFNADYINWLPLEKEIRNVIQVKEMNEDDSARTRERPLFDSVLSVGRNNNPYSREYGTRIFLLKGAKADINKRIANERDRRLRR